MRVTPQNETRVAGSQSEFRYGTIPPTLLFEPNDLPYPSTPVICCSHGPCHYVDGWVMWPAGVFPLLGLSRASVPAT